jgi:hypothetical protein
MGGLTNLIRRTARRLFRQPTARQAQRSKLASPRLEALENRVVPSGAGQGGGTLGVAHSVTIASGTYTLNNTGFLTFTPTGGKAAAIDNACAAFNLDGTGELWDLETGGTLWRLNTNIANGTTFVGNPAVDGWSLSDNNVGAISVSNIGTLMELKINGNLWRWNGGAAGSFGASALATGVTRADVDAAGDIVFLKDGTLWRVSPAATTSTPGAPGVLDLTTAAGAVDGTVVSFSLGNTTLAFQLGQLAGGASGEVLGTYDIGAAPSNLEFDHLFNDTDDPDFNISEYGVAADGILFSRTSDPGAGQGATNQTLRINFDSFDDDRLPPKVGDLDTLLTVNGGATPTTGSWFQISPDGTTVAVLSTGGAGGNNSDLSAYTEGFVAGVQTLGAETDLDTTNLGTSFGVSNDDRVYEYQNSGAAAGTMTLEQWKLTPAVAGTPVSVGVPKWTLGPNGQVSYSTAGVGGNSLFWFNDLATKKVNAHVLDFGVAPNGEQYDLETNGNLWGATGNLSGGNATASWTLLDGGTAAFTVGTNSQLFETEANGNLWKTTSTNGGWVKPFSGATTVPDQLFTVPDGSVLTLINGILEQITSDKAVGLVAGINTLRWGSGFTVATMVNRDTALGAFPGIVGYTPAEDPFAPDGLQFSNITYSGPMVAMTTAAV